MIGRLRGVVAEVGEEEALIDVGGVGYVVRCGARTLRRLPSLGEETLIHVDTQWTEAAGLRLYGFLARDERAAFLLLQGVQGVGPKAALGVLDVLAPAELAAAVAREDKAAVGRANGVGPKLAQRIVVELKGKAIAGPLLAGTATVVVEPSRRSSAGEAVGALLKLGIPEVSARRVVDQAAASLGEEAGESALIKAGAAGVGALTRIVSGESAPLEVTDKALWPQTLDEFVGQEQAKANLRVFIEAAGHRGEALDHVLLFGPPGLGKTTLAQIVARELKVNFRATSGPVLAKAGDLAAILTNLEPRDVLFIDEIHRLPANVEEILYPAMEDHALDLIIGEGPSARSIRIDLSPFTLVAATTRAGLLANPLRDRFGIPIRLDFYTPAELERVLDQAARKMGLSLAADGAAEIAGRARGTPRIAGRLLRRVRDFADAEGADLIDRACAARGLDRLEVDLLGLDSLDRRYLRALIEHYGGGPAGVETLSYAIAEARDAVEDVIEPFLLQQGFIQRTPRGRLACAKAYVHLGLTPPAQGAPQAGLFDDAL